MMVPVEELQQLGLEAARLSGRKKCRGFFSGTDWGQTQSEKHKVVLLLTII
jgi:hypothetical protein